MVRHFLMHLGFLFTNLVWGLLFLLCPPEVLAGVLL